MTFGLTQAQYQILEELLIKPLQRNKAEVYVFGSRARGTQHPFSDIDILYKEGNGNEVAESEIGQIKEALEESTNFSNLILEFHCAIVKKVLNFTIEV